MCKVCILNADRANRLQRPTLQTASSTSQKSIAVSCRICHAVSTFSSEAALVVDTNLQAMIEVLEGTAAAIQPCMRCERVEATTTCTECNLKLCSGCSDLIHVGRLKLHQIQYSSEGIDETLKPRMCEQMGHDGYRKDLYCIDCKCFLCVLCTQSLPTHKTHHVATVAEAAQVERTRLIESVHAADAFREELRRSVVQIDEVVEATIHNANEEVAVFAQTMDSLINALQEKKAALLREAKHMCETEVDQLRSSRDKIFSLAAKLNETVAGSNKAIRNRSAPLIISRRNEMEDQMRSWDPIVVSSASCPVFSFSRYKELVGAIESLCVKTAPVTEVAKGLDPNTNRARTLAISAHRHPASSRQPAVTSSTYQTTNRSLFAAPAEGGVTSPSHHVNITDPAGGILIEPSHLVSSGRPKPFAFLKSTFNGLSFSNGKRTVTSQHDANGGHDGFREVGWETAMCDTILRSGRHYFELSIDRYTTKDGHNIVIGLIFDGDYGVCDVIGEDNNSVGLDVGMGTKCIGGDYSLPYLGAGVIKQGDVIGVDIDFDKETLTYYHNGRHLGVAFSGLSRPCFAAVSLIHEQQVTLMFPVQRPL